MKTINKCLLLSTILLCSGCDTNKLPKITSDNILDKFSEITEMFTCLQKVEGTAPYDMKENEASDVLNYRTKEDFINNLSLEAYLPKDFVITLSDSDMPSTPLWENKIHHLVGDTSKQWSFQYGQYFQDPHHLVVNGCFNWMFLYNTNPDTTEKKFCTKQISSDVVSRKIDIDLFLKKRSSNIYEVSAQFELENSNYMFQLSYIYN